MKMNKRKLGALVLVMGLAMSSMTVCAEGEYYQKDSSAGTGSHSTTPQGTNYFYGDAEPGSPEGTLAAGITLGAGDTWDTGSKSYVYNIFIGEWDVVTCDFTIPSDCGTTTTSGSSGRSKEEKALIEAAQKEAAAKKAAQIIAHAETIALQTAAAEEGFADIAELQIAAEKHMSAGEYYNNAVTETFGIEEATPVAQGGNLVVDGVVTNMTATISKVDVAFVDSVRAAQEGTVLNVVDVRFPAKAATINFYMLGVAADANIVALQYVDGAWVEVEVAEVRADHVVLNLKQNGKVAFIAK